MVNEKSLGPQSSRYGVGALAALALSIGLAAVVYGGGLISFDPYNLPAWFFGPLGAYTLVYAFLGSGDTFYYLVWGSVMVAVGAASALYRLVSVFVVMGVLTIVLVVIGLFAYWRKGK